MDVYVYQAALLCAPCAESIRGTSPLPIGADSGDESSYDSDDWPKGPYAAGECDFPQYCDHCGRFLENSLTEEGRGYVYAAVLAYCADGAGSAAIVRAWAEFYELTLFGLLEYIDK